MVQPIDAQQTQTPSSIPLQKKMRGSVQLCDIYARIPTERKSAFTQQHMHRFPKRL